MRPGLPALTVIAAVVLTMQQAIIGIAAEPQVTQRQPQKYCLVKLDGSLAVSPRSPTDGIRFDIGLDCKVTPVRTPPSAASSASIRGTASLSAAPHYRGCKSHNDMMAGTLNETILDSYLYFFWEDTTAQITSVSSYSASPQAFFPYFLWSGPVQTGDVTTPASSVYVQEQEAYGYHDPWLGDQYNHTKSNLMRGYGNGTCSTEFAHWNYVCGGCSVNFSLTYVA